MRREEDNLITVFADWNDMVDKDLVFLGLSDLECRKSGIDTTQLVDGAQILLDDMHEWLVEAILVWMPKYKCWGARFDPDHGWHPRLGDPRALAELR
jgi:hypothetical protein